MSSQAEKISKTSEAIKALEICYGQTVALYGQVEREVAGINAAIAKVMNEKGQYVRRIKLSVDSKWEMHKEAGEMAGNVADLTRRTLSTEQAPCEITGDDLLYMHKQAKGIDHRGSEPEGYFEGIKPTELWELARKAHDPAQAYQVAAQKAAEEIVSCFALARDPGRIREVSGKTQLEMHWYLQKPFHSGAGMKLHYSSRAGSLAHALNAFAVHSAPEARAAFEAMVGIMYEFSQHRPIESRERFQLGAGVEMVTYNSALKLRLPKDLAGKLNVYVSEHAEEVFKEAA